MAGPFYSCDRPVACAVWGMALVGIVLRCFLILEKRVFSPVGGVPKGAYLSSSYKPSGEMCRGSLKGPI